MNLMLIVLRWMWADKSQQIGTGKPTMNQLMASGKTKPDGTKRERNEQWFHDAFFGL